MTGAVLILSTAPSPAEAERIARTLVEERLAACVQWTRVTSCYRWEGKMEQAEEVRLEIKTRADLTGAVEARIKALHSYDVPEVVVVAVTGGSAEYMAWIRAESEPYQTG